MTAQVFAPVWSWRCELLAPTGEPIPGTIANSRSGAIATTFAENMWPYAVMNGYRVHWVKEEQDND